MDYSKLPHYFDHKYTIYFGIDHDNVDVGNLIMTSHIWNQLLELFKDLSFVKKDYIVTKYCDIEKWSHQNNTIIFRDKLVKKIDNHPVSIIINECLILDQTKFPNLNKYHDQYFTSITTFNYHNIEINFETITQGINKYYIFSIIFILTHEIQLLHLSEIVNRIAKLNLPNFLTKNH